MENQTARTVHYRTCHLCEAMCGLAIEVEAGKVLSIRGDEKDVYSRGHLCPKAVALKDLHEDPDRLRTPVKKTAQGWQPITWEEAMEEVADRIITLQRRHGRDAVAMYTGNPTVHNTGTALYLYDFANALGTHNRYASHSLDQLPQLFVNGELFGHQAMFPVPDLERTDFFLIIGANPMVSNGSVMSTPDIAEKLKAIRQRGGKIVVVDPRRTRTARVADRHFFIRPGSDVLMLLAFVRTLFEEGLVRHSHVLDFTDHVSRLREHVQPYTPEFAERYTGIEAGELRALVHQFAKAESAVCYGRLGVSVQEFGSLCQWLIYCINILTGNLDRTGGMMFPRPAIDFLSLLKKEARANRWVSRVRALPETAGDLPTATLADEILTGGEGQVKGLITIAGNPVLSAPNGPRLSRALDQLEFMVAVDIYINETTRHADIILPPAAGLEVLHYDFVLYLVATRNAANFSPPVLPKGEHAKYDWEILYELQKRLEQAKDGFFAPLKHFFTDRLDPERRLDLGLRLGPYGGWGGRLGRKDGLSLRKLKAHPHGIDLGPLEPSLPQRLFTAGKRIDLAPERLLEDLPRVADKFPFTQNETIGEESGGTVNGRLLLIGRRHLLSNNSWMHNAPRLMKSGDRCTALLHPEDARKLGIVGGQQICVCSDTGKVLISAEISDEIMPGVISIPHGWGHDLEGAQLTLAGRHPGVNVNALTDDRLVEAVTGNAVFNGVPVWIETE